MLLNFPKPFPKPFPEPCPKPFPEPCPKPCPKPCPEPCPKPCPKPFPEVFPEVFPNISKSFVLNLIKISIIHVVAKYILLNNTAIARLNRFNKFCLLNFSSFIVALASVVAFSLVPCACTLGACM